MKVKELNEQASYFEDLTKHLGWRLLVSLIEEEIKSQTMLVMSDLENARLIEKSRIAGMKRVLQYPDEIIEQAHKLNEQLTKPPGSQ